VVLNLGFGSEFLGDLKDHDVIAGPITNSSGEGRPLANRLGDFALWLGDPTTWRDRKQFLLTFGQEKPAGIFDTRQAGSMSSPASLQP